MDPPLQDALTDEERAWIARDLALREDAAALAADLGRDPEDIYKTLRHLARTPAERLAIGLRHGRLGRAHRR